MRIVPHVETIISNWGNIKGHLPQNLQEVATDALVN